MSRYKRYLIIISSLFLFSACSFSSEIKNEKKVTNKKIKNFKTIPHKEFVFENEYIVYALEYENQKDPLNARKLYEELFSKTNKHEYLLRYLSLSFFIKDYKAVVLKASKNLYEDTKNYEAILRLYIYALVKTNEKQKALISLNKLLSSYSNASNYELQASLYISFDEYGKAYDSFFKAYSLNKNLNSFLSYTNIGFLKLNKQKESKKALEEYLNKKGFNYKVAVQLISFYNKDKENKKILKLLEEMYSFYKEINDIKQFENTKKILIGHLIKTDILKAIDFLEKDKSYEKVLLSLYQRLGKEKKAYLLLEKLYNKNKNIDYLAQMAILEFEMAKNKKEVLPKVSIKFEKVLKETNSAIYNNYYAYLLIDYDLDIKKGLKLVSKALKIDPRNAAYLDTLAWGEYKNKNCKEAFKVMKEVVELIGLKEKEIKEHWEKIKECK